MKKILCVTLSIIILLCNLSGCDSKNSTTSNEGSSTTTELTDEEKYNNALSLLESKNYSEAIEILKNINYLNSNNLMKSLSYVYACELFNEKDFSSAYTYFEQADNCSDAIHKKYTSAYYQGVKLVNEEIHWESVKWFRIALNDNEFKTAAEKHLISITQDLIGSGWIGSYTNDVGTILQVELKYYENNGSLYIGFADRNNGDYKSVLTMNGPLKIGAEKCKFYHDKKGFGYTDISFSFGSERKLYIYSDDEYDKEVLDGISFTGYAISSYIIKGEKYPTLSIPQIDSDGQLTTGSQVVKDKTSTTNVDESTTEKKSATSKEKETTANKINKDASKKNHTHKFSKATCEKAQTCSCGEVRGYPLGHNWDYADCEKPETCSICGLTRGAAYGHNWMSATCEYPETCYDCGKTRGKTLNHDWEDATCIEPKTCNVCGKTSGSKSDHKYKNEKCVYCGKKSKNFPSSSDIKVEYPEKLVDECVFEVMGYSIRNIDGYFENESSLYINFGVVDSKNSSDHIEYFGVIFYDSDNNDITNSTPYSSQYISSGSVLANLEAGDICSCEFKIPANCKKIVLVSIN